jgi:hypothetical protein
VYPIEDPSAYREAAARCRKEARSSTNPKEWVAMAEQWEWLADTANGSWLAPSKGRDNDERFLDLRADVSAAERGRRAAHALAP